MKEPIVSPQAVQAPSDIAPGRHGVPTGFRRSAPWRRVGTGLMLMLMPSPARPDDLLQLYQAALASDPVLNVARAQRNAEQEAVAQARATLRLQARIDATFGRERESGAGVPTVEGSRTYFNVGVTQVIFDAGLSRRLRVAEAAAESQNEALRAEQQALCLRLATAYLDALLAADTVGTAEANEAAYAKQVEQAEHLNSSGLGAQLDVDQSRVYLALARNETTVARQDLVDALGVLEEMTGLKSTQLRRLREDLPLVPPSPADVQAWARAAEESNPRILAARHDLDAAELSIAAALGARLPILGFNLGLGRTDSASSEEGDGRTNTSALLALTVPLYTGGATTAKARQAAHLRDGARATLESRRRAAARAATEAYGKVVSGIAQIESARASIEAAKSSLEASQIGRDVGTRSTSDLLLAIENLGLAQLAYARARHQVVLGRLQLAAAAGTLDQDDLSTVNGWLR
jgi:outer membrane protein